MGRNNVSVRRRRLEKFEENSLTISLIVLYAKNEKVSRCKSNPEK